MFIVELQESRPIVTPSPEDAVHQFRSRLKEHIKDDKDVSQFMVWDTDNGELYVIEHNKEYPRRYERLVHLDLAARKKLVEEMVFKAHCDDKVLHQLCEMAATCINTTEAYNDWVGEGDEADA